MMRASKTWILWALCSTSLACVLTDPVKTQCVTSTDCLNGRVCRAGACEINGSEAGGGHAGGGTGGNSGGGGGGEIPGDTCANPKLLDFSRGRVFDTARTTGAANNLTSSCFSDDADIVYTFSNPTQQAFSATVNGYNGYTHGSLFLRAENCSTGTDLTCERSMGTSAVQISIPSLDAGTYFLIVDGQRTAGGNGNYSLQAILGPGLDAGIGDTCDNPKTLTFFNGVAVDTATTTGAGSDLSSTCKSDSSDIVYTFNNPTPQPFTASLYGKGDYVFSTLYLRSGSCTSGTDLACSHLGTFGPPYLYVPSLAAGTYFLVADGENTDGGNGAYTVTAKLGN